MDTVRPPEEFTIPIHRSVIYGQKKKEYAQYSVKLPIKLIRLLKINEDCSLRVVAMPLKDGQVRPTIEVSVTDEKKEST